MSIREKAQQEPSNAEVEAAALGIARNHGFKDLQDADQHGFRKTYEADARAALNGARKCSER